MIGIFYYFYNFNFKKFIEIFYFCIYIVLEKRKKNYPPATARNRKRSANPTPSIPPSPSFKQSRRLIPSQFLCVLIRVSFRSHATSFIACLV